MTTPTVHGYPDWQRREEQANAIFLNVINQSIDFNATFGPVFVGAAKALNLKGDLSGNGLNLQFQWFAEQAATTNLGQTVLDARPGDSWTFTLPNLGPWLQILANTAGLGVVLNLLVSESSGQMVVVGATANWTPIFATTSIAAGATRTTDATVIVPGPATVWSDGEASHTIVVEAVNLSGTTREVLRKRQVGAGGISELVFLPPQHIRILTVNDDGAAAHVVRTGLVILPFWR